MIHVHVHKISDYIGEIDVDTDDPIQAKEQALKAIDEHKGDMNYRHTKTKYIAIIPQG